MEEKRRRSGRYRPIALSALLWMAGILSAVAAETGTVRLGIPQEVPCAAYIVALEQGYFGQEGLKVTAKPYPSGARALNDGLLAGEADFIVAAEVPVVMSSFGRDDFAVLAEIGTVHQYAKIVAGAKSGIRKPADLKGRRVATQKGSAVHFFLHLFLHRHRLSEKDVKLGFMKIEELPPALARGDIDAFSAREPFVGQARTALGSDGVVVFDEEALYAPIYVAVAAKRFLRDHPEAAKSLLKGLIRAEEFVKRQPGEAMKIVARKLDMPQATVADLWGSLAFNVRLSQSLLLAMEDQARWARDAKLAAGKTLPNYLDFIHADPLKSVRPRSVGIIR